MTTSFWRGLAWGVVLSMLLFWLPVAWLVLR